MEVINLLYLLMRNFYRADQEEESFPTFANKIGLLSRIREKFLDQIPLHEEQRLDKDRLFHGSRRIIRNSVKYCRPSNGLNEFS